MTDQESFYPAFPPDSRPSVSSGLSFSQACRKHVAETYKAVKVYLIVSKSISQTSTFAELRDELSGKVAGVRYGIRQHVPWEDVVDIANGVSVPTVIQSMC